MKKLTSLFVLLTIILWHSPALAATDVKNDAGLSTGLVSYFELEEASGSRADSHGPNTLTDVNTVGSAAGIVGSGADFESSSSEFLYIDDGTQVGLTPTNAFSVSFCFKMESNTSSNPVGKWLSTGNQREWRFELHQTGLAWQFTTTGSEQLNNKITYYPGGNVFNLGQLYCVVGTRDGADMSLYINSVEVASLTTASTGNVFNGTGRFAIGALGQATLYFDGVIDEVGFWSRALSSGEVAELYNSGAGIPYDAGSSPAPDRRIIITQKEI